MAYTDRVGDIFRVTMAFNYPLSQVEEVNFHYQIATAGTGDSRSQILSYVDSGVAAYLLGTISTTINYYGSKCTTVKANAQYAPVVSYVNSPGTAVGRPLPSQVRGLVSWKTAYAGPAYRGRSYLPTPADDFLSTGGVTSAAYVTILGNWATYMQGTITAGGSTIIPVVYHKTPTSDISSIADHIIGHVIGNYFATQRRSGAFGRANETPF